MPITDSKLRIVLTVAAFGLMCYTILFFLQRRAVGEMLALMRHELAVGNLAEVYNKYLSEDYRATLTFVEFRGSGPFVTGDWRNMRLLNPDVNLLGIPLNAVYRPRFCAIISTDFPIPLIFESEYDHKLAIPLRRVGAGWVIDGEIYAP